MHWIVEYVRITDCGSEYYKILWGSKCSCQLEFMDACLSGCGLCRPVCLILKLWFQNTQNMYNSQQNWSLSCSRFGGPHIFVACLWVALDCFATHIGFFRGLPAGTKFCTCGPERGSYGAWDTYVAAQWDPPWWTVEWYAWGCAQPSCEASGLVVAPQANEPSWMNSLTV